MKLPSSQLFTSVIISTFVCSQAFGNAGAPHVSGPSGASATNLPDASDPTANLPSIPSVNSAADSPPPEIKKPSGPKTDAQTCDPSLDLSFYKNLENYYCLQSAASDCPKGFSVLLEAMKMAAPGLLIGTAASILVMGGNDTFEAYLSNPNGKAQRLQSAKEAADALRHPELLKNPSFKKLQDELAQSPTPQKFRALIKSFLASNKTAGAHEALGGVLSLMPKKWNAKTAAGMIGVGILASTANQMNIYAMGLGTSSENQCKATQGADWIGLDSANQCRPQFKVTGHVVRFLELPHAKKMEILNSSPEVCAYYKEFNDHLRNWLKPTKTLTNISCSGNQVSYEVGDGDKRMRLGLTLDPEGHTTAMSGSRLPARPQSAEWLNDFRVGFADRGNERVIDKISFDELASLGSKSDSLKRINLSYDQLFEDASGSRMSENYPPVILSGLTIHKLYSEMVKACCSVKDDAIQGRCKAALEKPEAASLKALEKSASGAAQVK